MYCTVFVSHLVDDIYNLLFKKKQERIREAQLKNELLGQIEKKNKEIIELQLREKELRDELSRVQSSDLANKNALETISKEKVFFQEFRYVICHFLNFN